MKLLRYGPKGLERPGVLDSAGQIRDLSAVLDDLGGDSVALGALARLRSLDLTDLPRVDGPVRLGAPLSWVPNFYCVGLNYSAHALETGAAIPTEPVLFSKASTSLAGPEDAIIIPRGSRRTDWEVELGIVIGARCHHVSPSEALSHVAGYVAINDLSERDHQKDRGGQWIKGKSAPSFGKIGPWLVTADDVPDPQALDLRLWVNGDLRQNSNTSDMIFGVAQIIAYMSDFMELRPGDVIATGTPNGVGAGMVPPQFLRAGDRVELDVQGLGRQSSLVIDAF